MNRYKMKKDKIIHKEEQFRPAAENEMIALFDQLKKSTKKYPKWRIKIASWLYNHKLIKGWDWSPIDNKVTINW